MTSHGDPAEATSPTQVAPLYLRANLLGIPFGLAGLAQCWAASRTVLDVPRWIVDACWLLSFAAYLLVLGGLVRNMTAQRRLRAEVRDPVFGPFTTLVAILPMLYGVALADHLPALGTTVYVVALALTVAAGSWMSAWWIIGRLDVAQWHPGYFLPTVAGGLIAANGAAVLGFGALAQLMMGYGTFCWLALNSILLGRLFLGSPLPTALVPTLAIEAAPPAVAGAAWLAINGDQRDLLLTALTGYGVLMLGVQVVLVPLFRRVPFGPGWWAFTFSYAAVAGFAIRWLPLTTLDGRVQDVLAMAVLLVVTAAIATVATRSLMAVRDGTFLPRKPLAAPAGQVPPRVART